MKEIAIIVAGGSGTRFGGQVPKQFLSLCGEPVLMHTVRAFAGPHRRLVVVLPEAHIAWWQDLCRDHKFDLPHRVVAGGASRWESVRNGLTAYDASELFDADYTYGGEHVELGYRFPGEPMDLVLLSLSQPAKQGDGGVWCVERVHYVYTDYDMTDTQLVFPAALGVDQTAADYYADLQAACDAGESPELLTPTGAAVRYARSAAWLFGEDVSASDFEVVESLG